MFFIFLCVVNKILILAIILIWLILYPIGMSNQELVNAGMKTMDETDQAIERSKQVSHIKLVPPLALDLCSYLTPVKM